MLSLIFFALLEFVQQGRTEAEALDKLFVCLYPIRVPALNLRSREGSNKFNQGGRSCRYPPPDPTLQKISAVYWPAFEVEHGAAKNADAVPCSR